MKLMVLAGGFGTRLRSAVGDCPKALAPVAGYPFLRLQIEHWRNQGVKELCFLLHHQANQIISFIESQKSDLLGNCHVNWVIEASAMGTGGAIANAVKEMGLRGDFLVTNADTWLGTGIVELMSSTSPSMAVLHVSDVGRYGQVDFDADFYVTRFAEKSPITASGWINAGIFRLNSNLFDNWDGKPLSLERSIFSNLVQRRCLRAAPLQTDFMDIGIPADYHRFCRWVEGGRKGAL